MILFKFTVRFLKLKGMSMNHTDDIYINSKTMSDAISILENNFFDDEFEVIDSCKIKGRFLK